MLLADSTVAALWVAAVATVILAFPVCWGAFLGVRKVWRGFKARIIAAHDAETEEKSREKAEQDRNARLENAATLINAFDGKLDAALKNQDTRTDAKLGKLTEKIDNVNARVESIQEAVNEIKNGNGKH